MTDYSPVLILAGATVALAMVAGHYIQAGWLRHNLARYVWGVGWTLAASGLAYAATGLDAFALIAGGFVAAGAATAGCYLADEWWHGRMAREQERVRRGETD